MKGISTKRWLWLIILLSVALRIGAALFMGNGEVVALPGTADQVSYHNLALRVLNGHGFSFGENWWPATKANTPTAHWSFLYTFYLIAVYAVMGVQPLVARLLQAVAVGVLQPWLAYYLAGRVLTETSWSPARRERIALIAAGITAIYIYFIYYAASLMTEPFYGVGVLATLSLALTVVQRANRPGIWPTALLFAISMTATVLLRQLFMLVLPFIFLWMLWAARQGGLRGPAVRRVFGTQVVAGVLLLLAILPITLYNYQRFERFVLLNTNAGYVLFWGNHPTHGTRFISAEEMGNNYQSLIPNELRGLDEAALDQALLAEGIGFIVDDPSRYVLLSLSRIPAYFYFWPDTTSGTLSNISRVASFGIFLPFMLYGLVRVWGNSEGKTGRRWQWQRPGAAIWLLYIFMAVYTLIHLLTWALIRYRLPVDSVLVLFAAIALEEVVQLLAAGPAGRLVAPKESRVNEHA